MNDIDSCCYGREPAMTQLRELRGDLACAYRGLTGFTKEQGAEMQAAERLARVQLRLARKERDALRAAVDAAERLYVLEHTIAKNDLVLDFLDKLKAARAALAKESKL